MLSAYSIPIGHIGIQCAAPRQHQSWHLRSNHNFTNKYNRVINLVSVINKTKIQGALLGFVFTVCHVNVFCQYSVITRLRYETFQSLKYLPTNYSTFSITWYFAETMLPAHPPSTKLWSKQEKSYQSLPCHTLTTIYTFYVCGYFQKSTTLGQYLI